MHVLKVEIAPSACPQSSNDTEEEEKIQGLGEGEEDVGEDLKIVRSK